MSTRDKFYLLILAASVAGAIVTMLTPLVILLARRLGAVDHPGGRRVHDSITPRMGGIAIALGALAGALSVAWVPGIARFGHVPLGSLFFASCGMVILGFWDDFSQIPARRKLLVQILLASACWFGGIRVERLNLPTIGMFEFPTIIGFAITVCWVVGISNAINLLDGLDGLAAGVVAIVTATIMLGSVMNGNANPFILFTTGSLCASCLAFLIFNSHPARIFMGDTGSLFLGFVLANLSILSFSKETTATALAIPILALGVPIADTMLAFMRRVLNGRSPFVADRHHLHHVLFRVGMTSRRAVMIIHTGTGVLCICSLLSMLMGIQFQMLGYLILLIGLLGLYVRVRRHDRQLQAEQEDASSNASLSQSLVEVVND